MRDAFCPECRGDLDEAPTRKQAPLETSGETAVAWSEDVWYATDDALFRPIRFSWHHGRGEIEPDGDGFQFVGSNATFTLTPVEDIGLVGPFFPRPMIVSLVIGDALVLLCAAVGIFNFLTLFNPLTYVFLVLINLFTIAVWTTAWVKVVYRDEGEMMQTAYFTPRSVMERWRGGAKRLAARLEQHLSSEQQA